MFDFLPFITSSCHVIRKTARSSPLVSPQIRESPKGIIFMPEHVARNAEGDDVARLAKEKGVFGFVVETRKRPWERDVKGIKATKKRVWYVETAASRDAWVVALRNAARLRAIEDRYLIDWSPTGLLGSGATADVRRCSKVERARGYVENPAYRYVSCESFSQLKFDSPPLTYVTMQKGELFGGFDARWHPAWHAPRQRHRWHRCRSSNRGPHTWRAREKAESQHTSHSESHRR